MAVVLLIPGVSLGSLRLAKLHPRLENSAASLLPYVAIQTQMLPSNPSRIAMHSLRRVLRNSRSAVGMTHYAA